MSNIIQNTYELFTDIDGNPLEDGYIFIGIAGLDPIANPLQAYWDEALTVPASAIRTKGGYPVHSTFPGRLYVATNYSVLVQNKRGLAVYASVNSKAMTLFPDGIEFIDDRIAMQELESGILTAGWNTIGIVRSTSNASGSADFAIARTNSRSTMKFKAQFGNSTGVKTHDNTDIEIVGLNDSDGYFEGVRIAKSDSVVAGAKIQVKVSTSAPIFVLKSMNTGRVYGWELVDPYLDEAPVELPDGITAATFLEAGEELILNTASGSFPVGLQVHKLSDDVVRIEAPWEQEPKQALSVEIIYGSAGVVAAMGGAAVTLDNTFTEGSPVLVGKKVFFALSKTGAFSGFSANTLGYITVATDEASIKLS